MVVVAAFRKSAAYRADRDHFQAKRSENDCIFLANGLVILFQPSLCVTTSLFGRSDVFFSSQVSYTLGRFTKRQFYSTSKLPPIKRLKQTVSAWASKLKLPDAALRQPPNSRFYSCLCSCVVLLKGFTPLWLSALVTKVKRNKLKLKGNVGGEN